MIDKLHTHGLIDFVHRLFTELDRVSVKIGLGISGSLVSFTDWKIADFTALATFIFVVAQTGLLVPKYKAMFKNRKAKKKKIKR